MPEAGQRQLRRAQAAADRVLTLEHEHATPACASTIAAASPFGPEPTTIASGGTARTLDAARRPLPTVEYARYASAVRLILVRHAEAGPGQPDASALAHDAGREAAQRARGPARGRAAERRALEPAAARPRDRDADRRGRRRRRSRSTTASRRAPTLDDVRAAVAGRGETSSSSSATSPICGEIVLALTGEQVRFSTGS